VSAAARLTLKAAREEEARIAAYAAGSVDLAYLRNITAKLTIAMDALEHELAAPNAGREQLEGMLYLGDIEPTDAAPTLSFTEFESRRAA